MSVKSSVKVLWITDPWETLDHRRDSTLRLAQESLLLGQKSYGCDYRNIFAEHSKIRIEARQFLEIPKDRSPTEIKRGPPEFFSPEDFFSIHYRPDPPVGLNYIHPLQLLWSHVRKSKKTEIINPATVLTLCGEKTEALNVPGLSPPTLISSNWIRLQEFGRKMGKTVLKPLNSAQSKGIELIDWTNSTGEDQARRVLSKSTEEFKIPILLQRFQPEIADGEQRLWFLDGKFLASVQKLPIPGDFRVNLDQGSEVRARALGAKEKKAIPAISRHLKTLKVRLAAIDLIGGYITDFNFTSPGLLAVMENVLDTNLARPIIKKLARRWN